MPENQLYHKQQPPTEDWVHNQNYKGWQLLGTGRMSRIQNKLAERLENMLIILIRINIVSQNLIKATVHSL